MQRVPLLRFMLRSAGAMAWLLVVMGMGSALVNGGLVAVVHRALSADAAARAGLILTFVGLGLGKVLTAWLSGTLVNSFAQESITELRRAIIRQLLRVPYRQLERVGPARVHAGLTQDVGSLSAALQSMPAVVTNVAILLGGAGYLFYLEPVAALTLSLLAPAGWAIYWALSRRAVRELELHRHALDRLYQHFGSLTSGAKELKMNAARRTAFMREAVLETTESMLVHDLSGRARYLAGQAANGTIVLAMLGLALFAVPTGLDLAEEDVSGYVLTGLYLIGPLTALLRMLPMFALARIALGRIDALGVDLEREGGEPESGRDAAEIMETVELREATMRYEQREGAFVLGPVSLSVSPGEVLFITGGNGSGKSTLAKLLCGLYEPEQGALCWNGDAVRFDNRDRYRQLWSTVFSEFHVFDRFYGIDPRVLQPRADELLERLGLSDVARIDEGALSSVELSRGQRKRLALLAALIEDRSAYLFDEWAADQDPEFKRVFYRELIPELRARGKAVVVVTHDDRYFDAADRLLKMEAGRVVPQHTDA